MGLFTSSIDILGFVLILVICVLFFLMTRYLSKTAMVQKAYRKITNKGNLELLQQMKKSKSSFFNYDIIQKYIMSSGLGYMTKNKLTPMLYILAKFGLAAIGFLAGLQLNLLIAVLLLLLGFFFLDIVASVSNKSDNDAMLDDVKNIYDTLRIQTKAGVYISGALSECYLVVKNERLKRALLELTSDISAKNNITEALNDFSGKFKNEYIDVLSIIIKQSLKSGQAVKLFDDIKLQISDIDSAIATKEKGKIKGRISIVQVSVYVGILAVTLFGVASSLMGERLF